VTVELGDKVAVITGSGGGLGAAMGRVFAEAGMAVALLDSDEAAATQAAAALADEHGAPTTACRDDVGDTASVDAAAGHVESVLGGCDVVCANVGVQQFGASFRPMYQERRAAMDVALDRMEAS
jgi:NAD(P)-dependent dehydrogenase (short-subunit alcohol dehydrogenase family)